MSTIAPNNLAASDAGPSHRDLAYEVIRRSIVLGDTKQGTRINERVLAEKLGISRVPVREAMLCLHGEGLLSKSKCGLEVTRLSAEDADYQMEFRAIVECAAVRLAAQRITPELKDRLQSELKRQMVLGYDRDWRAFHESDLIYHQLILETSQNPSLLRLSGTLALGLIMHGDHSGSFEKTLNGHRGIFNAIVSEDGEEAARLMYDHLITDNTPSQGQQADD